MKLTGESKLEHGGGWKPQRVHHLQWTPAVEVPKVYILREPQQPCDWTIEIQFLSINKRSTSR